LASFFFHTDVTVVVAKGCAPVVSIWKTRFLKCGASLKLSCLCSVCKCESQLRHEMSTCSYSFTWLIIHLFLEPPIRYTFISIPTERHYFTSVLDA